MKEQSKQITITSSQSEVSTMVIEPLDGYTGEQIAAGLNSGRMIKWNRGKQIVDVVIKNAAGKIWTLGFSVMDSGGQETILAPDEGYEATLTPVASIVSLNKKPEKQDWRPETEWTSYE